MPRSTTSAHAAAADDEWLFTEATLQHTASITDGISLVEERRLRRHASRFIHCLGDELNRTSDYQRERGGGGNNLTQLCMTAAMIHLQRFYVYHSFKMFDGRDIAVVAILVASKTEECPRQLQHIIRCWYKLKHPTSGEMSMERLHDACKFFITLENIMLMTIAFNINIKVPHFLIVPFFRTESFKRIMEHNNSRRKSAGITNLVTERDVSEAAYYLASDLLCLTVMGLQHPPDVLAAVITNCTLSHAELEARSLEHVLPAAPALHAHARIRD